MRASLSVRSVRGVEHVAHRLLAAPHQRIALHLFGDVVEGEQEPERMPISA
jgi:hypothetical protein